MAETDEVLMRQVAEGDLEQMSPLFARYQTPLYQFFRRQGLQPAESEDLAQEVFFRVLRARHTYHREAPFRAWIYQIARNVRTDHLRRAVRETQVDDEFGDTFVAKERRMDEVLQESETTAALRKALEQLPERKRELLLLSRYQGMKYREIATMMGCDVNTIKVRIHRSMQDLRQNFLALTERSAG
ncbi:MAG: RNA polymerase sigma factor [Bryobacterales bacterium]|nr:RNA polymerase sigma factor [Bryobacterales bacterium]